MPFTIGLSGVTGANGSTFSSGVLIGQIFYDTDNTPTDGKLFMGQTYQWSDNPLLQAKFIANSHGFIVDNGDGSFDIASHSDFVRAGVTNIGAHVDDTTAVNGLSGTVVDANPSGRQTNRRIGGSNAAHPQETNTTRSVSLTGDEETAPNHRNAYFGIYGDAALVPMAAALVAPVKPSTYFYASINDNTEDTSVSNNDTIDLDFMTIQFNPEALTLISTGLDFASPSGGIATGNITRALKIPAAITESRDIKLEFFAEMEPETVEDEAFSIEFYKNGEYITQARATSDGDSGSSTFLIKYFGTLTGGDEFSFKAINIDGNDDQSGQNYALTIEPIFINN